MGAIIILPDAIVSKGYNGAPAVRFSEDGSRASMTVGYPTYAKNAPNNTKWLNFYVTFQQGMLEKIRRMKLKEYSHITLAGEYDLWERVDRETGEIKPTPTLRAFYIEYVRSGGKGSAQTEPAAQQQKEEQLVSPDQLPNFLGFEPLGGTNPYFSPMEQPNQDENASS